MTVRARAACAAIVAAMATGACGQKGAPLPPLRPLPVAPADLSARVVGDRVHLRFQVPSASQDREAPLSVVRVDLYAYSSMSGDAPPAPLEIARREYLVGSIDVRPLPPEDAPPPATPEPPDPRPAPGEYATWSETMPASWVSPPARRTSPAPIPPATVPLLMAPSGVTVLVRPIALPSRYYVAVAVSSRGRQGLPSTVLAVRAGAAPAAPTDLAVTSDATTTTLTWSAPEGAGVAVYAASAAGQEEPAALDATPIFTGTWSTPVVFGEERCYTARRVIVAGTVRYESESAVPVCLTPKDTFAPAAPGQPFGAAELGRITVEWPAVAESDLAGYHVLRGDGPGATLQQLTTAPVTATMFVDQAVRAGVEYVYVIVAVDRAGNISAQSAPVRLVGR